MSDATPSAVLTPRLDPRVQFKQVGEIQLLVHPRHKTSLKLGPQRSPSGSMDVAELEELESIISSQEVWAFKISWSCSTGSGIGACSTERRSARRSSLTTMSAPWIALGAGAAAGPARQLLPLKIQAEWLRPLGFLALTQPAGTALRLCSASQECRPPARSSPP